MSHLCISFGHDRPGEKPVSTGKRGTVSKAAFASRDMPPTILVATPLTFTAVGKTVRFQVKEEVASTADIGRIADFGDQATP